MTEVGVRLWPVLRERRRSYYDWVVLRVADVGAELSRLALG